MTHREHADNCKDQQGGRRKTRLQAWMQEAELPQLQTLRCCRATPSHMQHEHESSGVRLHVRALHLQLVQGGEGTSHENALLALLRWPHGARLLRSRDQRRGWLQHIALSTDARRQLVVAMLTIRSL